MNQSAAFTDMPTARQFNVLAQRYRRATGWRLCGCDRTGTMRHGQCEQGPCSKDEACQSIRGQAIAEAARWGEPCVLCGPCGRALWAVPMMRNQQICGGLLAVGVALQRPRRAGALDRRILRACRVLLDFATGQNLTNAAYLAERRQFAHRESERAEALHALKDRLYDDIRSTYLHEEPALLAAIRRGERTEARRILNRVLAAIYAVGGPHTVLLKSLALELVVIMTRAAVQAGGDPTQILGLNFQSLTALARIADREGLALWLCDMLEQLVDAIEANTRRPNSVQLAHALEFIQARLADDLRREDVARAAGLSPSHFSHLMRAKTGWSFTELLTRLRIDHACHLLAHTELSLAHLALECGFTDQSYFNRVFRRCTGRTPGDFRRLQSSARKSQKNARASNPSAPAFC